MADCDIDYYNTLTLSIDMQLLAIHAKRVTVMSKDMNLARILRGEASLEDRATLNRRQ